MAKKIIEIVLNILIFEENKKYVAYSPQLNLYINGNSIDDAKKAVRAGVGLLLSSWNEKGTLVRKLEELGLINKKNYNKIYQDFISNTLKVPLSLLKQKEYTKSRINIKFPASL